MEYLVSDLCCGLSGLSLETINLYSEASDHEGIDRSHSTVTCCSSFHHPNDNPVCHNSEDVLLNLEMNSRNENIQAQLQTLSLLMLSVLHC